MTPEMILFFVRIYSTFLFCNIENIDALNKRKTDKKSQKIYIFHICSSELFVLVSDSVYLKTF